MQPVSASSHRDQNHPSRSYIYNKKLSGYQQPKTEILTTQTASRPRSSSSVDVFGSLCCGGLTRRRKSGAQETRQIMECRQG
jgi:hypothetical protein